MRSIKNLLLVVLLLLTLAPSSSAAYSFYRTVTVDHTKVHNTDQTNFPVLVSGTYSYLIPVASGGTKVQNASGFDIGFFTTTACTTKMDWETELFTAASGLVDYWIRVPNLTTATDFVFYLCYGDASITTDQSNKNGVWASTFKGVYHLPNGTTLGALDSTSNAQNGTITSATAVAGQIDGGANLTSAGSQKIVTSTVSSLAGASKVTLQGWFKRTISGSAVFFGTDSGSALNRISIEPYTDGNLYVAVSNTGLNYAYVAFSSSDTSWHKVDAVFDGSLSGNTKLAFYLDGAVQSLTYVLTLPTTTNSSPLKMGADDLNGIYTNCILDEVRIIAGAAFSADWISTEYDMETSTFYTIGAEISLHNASGSRLIIQ